jgi:hypothetical protein
MKKGKSYGVKPSTVSKMEDRLITIYVMSKEFPVQSKKINEVLSSTIKHIITKKGIIKHCGNRKYLWNTVKPNRDMALAVAKEQYDLQRTYYKEEPIQKNRPTIKEKKSIETLFPEYIFTDSAPKPTTRRKPTPIAEKKKPKKVTKLLWGLYTKIEY